MKHLYLIQDHTYSPILSFERMKRSQKTKFSQAKSIWYTAKAFHHPEIFLKCTKQLGISRDWERNSLPHASLSYPSWDILTSGIFPCISVYPGIRRLGSLPKSIALCNCMRSKRSSMISLSFVYQLTSILQSDFSLRKYEFSQSYSPYKYKNET